MNRFQSNLKAEDDYIQKSIIDFNILTKGDKEHFFYLISDDEYYNDFLRLSEESKILLFRIMCQNYQILNDECLYKLINFFIRINTRDFHKELINSIDYYADIISLVKNMIKKHNEYSSRTKNCFDNNKTLHQFVWLSVFSQEISDLIQIFLLDLVENEKQIFYFAKTTEIKSSIITFVQYNPYCNHKEIFFRLYKKDKNFAIKNKDNFKDIDKYLAIL